MPKSLAQMRAEAASRKRRTRRSHTICLAVDLLAEVQSLADERYNLVGEQDPDDERPKKPTRVNPPHMVRLNEILDRLAELEAEMAEHTGELVVEAIDMGEWMRWVDDNPARSEGEPGHDRDARVTSGICDADALVADLGRYAHTWNGDPVTNEDWAHVYESAAPGDLLDVARSIVFMHETGTNLPKLRSSLRELRTSATD